MTDAFVFETPLGAAGIAWSGRRVCGFALPEEDRESVAARLQVAAGARLAEGAPGWIASLLARVRGHLDGAVDDFADVALDLDGLSPFRQRVSDAARAVAPGETTRYGALAAAAGSPGAARAVGQAMARNPIPLFVPCHRVLGDGGALTGFSSPGALTAKLRLLTVEGADLGALAEAGVRHLRRVDPAVASVIRRAGPYRLAREQREDPLTALAESIVHQQVSMAAGRTIFGRLKGLAGDPRIDPERLATLPVESLRGAGLSRQKASYLQDLARRALDGELPLERLERMDDERVIEALTRVKGIGRWSAEMFLMFRLGRLDVLPVADLGLQKGAQLAYGLETLPDAATLRRLAEPWRPYRSIGTWYLWRALESGGI